MGILYRDDKNFEEAENAFEYAKNSHGYENYQIAHTTAKNYMEWGLWSVKNIPSQAAYLFDEGASRMFNLLLRWNYPDAICFSAHTYIDMNIKYYSEKNQIPSANIWHMMNTCMKRFVDNANSVDKFLKGIAFNMYNFAKKNNLQIEYSKEIHEIIKQNGNISTYAVSEVTFDELPSYE